MSEEASLAKWLRLPSCLYGNVLILCFTESLAALNVSGNVNVLSRKSEGFGPHFCGYFHFNINFTIIMWVHMMMRLSSNVGFGDIGLRSLIQSVPQREKYIQKLFKIQLLELIL